MVSEVALENLQDFNKPILEKAPKLDGKLKIFSIQKIGNIEWDRKTEIYREKRTLEKTWLQQ